MRKWTKKEDDLLKKLVASKSIAEIAEELNLSYGVVKYRISKLGIKIKKPEITPDFIVEQTIKKETEKELIAEALRAHKGNKRKAAQFLGLQRSVLYLKVKKYNLNKNGF